MVAIDFDGVAEGHVSIKMVRLHIGSVTGLLFSGDTDRLVAAIDSNQTRNQTRNQVQFLATAKQRSG